MLKALRDLLIKTAIFAIIIYILLTFFFGIHYVKGNNMYPMVKDGDLMITFKKEEYRLNEVVVYEKDGKMMIGRIVAMPDSKVECDEYGLKVNGAYPAEEIFYQTTFPEGTVNLPYSTGQTEYFIMNDSREEMADSRMFGAISEENLHGKAIYIFRRRSF